jgi:pyruvate/2-oxoglutarate dehydrogenase complex dihydrolipoamide dehydrogenase (E3) component
MPRTTRDGSLGCCEIDTISLIPDREPAMHDLVVIGGGRAGRKVAAAAARVGARVALIEKNPPAGGSTGADCWPSKGLIQSARRAHQVREAARFGINTTPPQIDFSAVVGHVRAVAAELRHRELAEVQDRAGIDVHHGSAAFSAYDTVQVDGTTSLPGQRFIIATGSRASVPAIPGLAEAGYIDGGSIWSLSTLPRSVTVVSAEPAGIEFAQCLARLGARVTLLTESTHLFPEDDPEASELLTRLLTAEGVIIQTGVEITKVEVRGAEKVCKTRDKGTGATAETASDALLIAAGRLANVEGLNLEAVGIHADPAHGIEVNEQLQTHCTRVYAIGDVLMKHFSAHIAEQEAAVAFQNAMLRMHRKVNYGTIPWVTFTDPEVAGIGITEAQANALNLPCRTYRLGFDEVDRALIEGRTDGFARVVTAAATGKILGATVVGEEAGMIINEIAFAMARNMRLRKLAAAIPIYPTYGSVLRNLALRAKAGNLEKGYIQKALKLFYGFMPRVTADNGKSGSEAARAEPGPGPSAPHGHGH